jgi:hypothetical protein
MRIFGLVLITIGCLLLALKHAPAQSDIMTGITCAGDAFKFCPQTMHGSQLVPDAIEACLRAHVKQLSPSCRAAVNGHKKQER